MNPEQRLPRTRPGLAARVAILGAIFFVEKIALSQLVDSARAGTSEGFGALLHHAQHLGFRFLVAFAAAVLLFSYVAGGAKLEAVDGEMRAAPIRLRWLAAHMLAAVCLAPLTFLLYRPEVSPLPIGAVTSIGLIIAAAGACCAVVALGPWSVWRKAAHALGGLWIYAAVAALISAAALPLTQRLWGPTATLTFHLVRWILTPVLPGLISDPATRLLQTPYFGVEIAEICSGLEGVGLVLAFSSAWLIYFRREYIFPRALLLIPAAVLTIFALNVLRIALLVLIGNAGFHDVAIYGFHSQAGWIGFICVACGLVLISRRTPWLYRHATTTAAPAAVVHNPTAAFLMPLLAILAAGTLARAMSSDFEYLYPLRVFAALWMLLRYRARLAAALSWTWSWRGVAAGAAVFALWVAAAHFIAPPASLPAKLAALPPGARAFWIACRLAGSVILVPIAEELAYRGYLMRRIISADFEHVPFRAVSLISLAISSLVFGLAHGSMWAAGTAAGLAYGLLLIRRENFGEAVAAHMVSNALVAAAVLFGGQWQLW